MSRRKRYRPGHWTPRQTQLLRKEYRTCDNPRDLARRLGKTYSALKSRARLLGLMRKYKTGQWKPARDAQLIKWYPRKTNAWIARHLKVKPSAVDARAFKLGLKKDPEWKYLNSMKTAFKKGQAPPNKGKKQKEFMSARAIRRTKATRFKKGQLPHNTGRDGEIRIRRTSTARGRRPYQMIRISLGKWMELQKYNWEKKYGPIPEGMVLRCRSGDTLDCRPDNWQLITKRENALLNSGSLHLADGYVAMTIATKNNPELIPEIMKDKKLIELKRQQLLLKRTIREQSSKSN